MFASYKSNSPSNHSYGMGCSKVMVAMVISMNNVMNTLMLHVYSVAMSLLDLVLRLCIVVL